MNPACSESLLMNDTDVRFHLLHTYILKRVMLAVTSASAVSLNEEIWEFAHIGTNVYYTSVLKRTLADTGICLN